MSRDQSRPDIGSADTELAHLPSRRERTDEHAPPGARSRNLGELNLAYARLDERQKKHGEALIYIEGKADDANTILNGKPGEPGSGLVSIVATLTANVASVSQAVKETNDAQGKRQWLMIVLLLVIAGAVVWNTLKPLP